MTIVTTFPAHNCYFTALWSYNNKPWAVSGKVYSGKYSFYDHKEGKYYQSDSLVSALQSDHTFSTTIIVNEV